MSTISQGRSSELATVERTIEDTTDGFVATLLVANSLDNPLVVRVVDELPAHAAVDGITLHTETAPARWGIADGDLVMEFAVEPGDPTAISYDVSTTALPDTPQPVRVELAQPVAPDDIGDDGAVPAFRDTLSISSGPVGMFVSTSETDADGTEASDDEVRQAIQAVSDPGPSVDMPSSGPTIDLADPPD